MTAQSDEYVSSAVTARLVSAQNGVAPGSTAISAGLHLKLEDGWKTYWRSPGEVGIPPTVDWTGSQNIEDVTILWPAPKRFTAFGIENFGYKDEVLFPLQVKLNDANKPAALQASVSLLVCSDICVPLNFDLSLSLSLGVAIDSTSAKSIANFAKQVPVDTGAFGLSTPAAHMSQSADKLTIVATSQRAFSAPDVFPEFGSGTAFGKPDIRLSKDSRTIWAELPILVLAENSSALQITITDGDRAVTYEPALVDTAPAPPYLAQAKTTQLSEILWIALIAGLGGFILNAMPCVLPVLSIKISSAIKMRGYSTARVRSGFLMTAFGVVSFMWILAAGTVVARNIGLSVGWGLQFQNVYFLGIMVLVLAIFTANLIGLFEIALPSSWQTRLAKSDGTPGYLGDFLTGSLAAVLATPCTAPFIGTAIAFALVGRPIDIFVIFSALGIGLALPYLLFALRPGWVQLMPRPGRWMMWLKLGLAILLGATLIWLIWVLENVGGLVPVILTIAVALGLVLALSLRKPFRWAFGALLAAAVGSTALFPIWLQNDPSAPDTLATYWVPFDRARIAREVSQGNVVFVDVTADWCLTCKANKSLVLDRGLVKQTLASDDVLAMQADWTRPDDSISRYLAQFNRYGIPFNVVYGPNSPDGFVLPELLTGDVVMTSIKNAASIKNTHTN